MHTKYGFRLAREEQVEECKSRARLWEHEKTGARVLSFRNDDENKVFGVSFRTPPADSTGLPHILEHSVLCGSEKYPVKEPFVELLKGSLQTFLNAFTFPDKTCYPVASANERDFRNLTDVYLDAVFFPRIGREVLEQEGWHLEKDDTGEFIFKGVVYNEMKGVFSSPEAVLSRHSLRALFPDTIYGLESGGDPEVIPTLTYEQFINFHRACYHPSNGRFWYWGNDDEDARLEQLGAVLDRFGRQNPAPEVGIQKPFAEPVRLELPYAAGEDEDKELMSCNWVLATAEDTERMLSLRMLEHVLLGMPASPLRRALIESGLGEDLTASGMEEDLLQVVFSVGLRGLEPGGADAAERLIMDTLSGLARDGVPPECAAAAVNSVEFALREKNTGRFPVGLALMLQSLATWLHDGDPLSPLRYEAPLARIKAAIEAGGFFEGLIRAYFLENTHRATLVLLPDSSLAERQQREEAERVRERVQYLSEGAKDALQSRAEELRRMQEAPDDPTALAAIPRLGVGDMPRENQSLPLEKAAQEPPLWFHDLPTSGIAYAQALFRLDGVPAHQFPLLPLFGRALLEMGTAKRDFLDLNMTIACKTGGMDADSLLLTAREDGRALPLLSVAGKAAPDTVPDLFGLLAEVLAEARFDDRERFGRMVLEEKARLEHALVPSGHTFVAARLRAGYSASGRLAELTGGVSHLHYLRELAARVEKYWPGVLSELEELRARVLTRENCLFNLTGEAVAREKLLGLAASLTAALPAGAPTAFQNWPADAPPRNEALILPSQVNYVGLGADMFAAGYRYHGSAQVIMKQVRTGWLWEKVRVQGGAYGAFCFLDRFTGSFALVSYRDPNIAATLDTFRRTAEHLATSAPDKRELESAIVGAIGELDAYMLPDAKGMASFAREYAGDTKEIRRQLRDEVLSTTAGHFRQFGEALASALQNASQCALGGADLERYATEQDWAIQKLL